MINKNAILRLALYSITLTAWCVKAQVDFKVPTDDEIRRARETFASLPRPIEYSMERTNTPLLILCRIKLRNTTKKFADTISFCALAYALWPMLDVPKSNAEAAIVLLGASGEQFSAQSLTYIDASSPGNWDSMGRTYIADCKRAIRLAFKQSDSWYPHKVLFDRETVLSESKTNEAMRAAYVEAMQKALADPKIRTENPLEAHNILLLLYSLDRQNSVLGYALDSHHPNLL